MLKKILIEFGKYFDWRDFSMSFVICIQGKRTYINGKN